MDETYSEVIKVRVTPAMRKLLEHSAKRDGVTVSESIRKAISTYHGFEFFLDHHFGDTPQKTEQPR